MKTMKAKSKLALRRVRNRKRKRKHIVAWSAPFDEGMQQKYQEIFTKTEKEKNEMWAEHDNVFYVGANSFFICEDYPHPINEMRFGSQLSTIQYAVRYYGLPSEESIFSNGMGYCFIKNGELKGFRILVE